MRAFPKFHELAGKIAAVFVKTEDVALQPLLWSVKDLKDNSLNHEIVERCFDEIAADGLIEGREMKVVTHCAGAWARREDN